jgi:hypothetical protein
MYRDLVDFKASMATTNTPPTLLVADAIAALSKSLNNVVSMLSRFLTRES